MKNDQRSECIGKIYIDPVALCERLAELERKQKQAVPEGWELPVDLTPCYSDLIADLFGIPEDNTNVIVEKYGYIEEIEHKDEISSRDWIDETWIDFVDGDTDAASFVRELMAEGRRWEAISKRGSVTPAHPERHG